MAECRFGMDRDAAVATQRDGDRECDQLADLGSQQILFASGRTEFDISLDGVGTELSHMLHAGCQLFTIVVPIKHHVSVLHCGHRPRVLGLLSHAAIPSYLTSVNSRQGYYATARASPQQPSTYRQYGTQ